MIDLGAPMFPGLDLSFVMGALLQFLFAMLRIGAFLVASPIFGARFVPLPVRIIAVVALSVVVFSNVALPNISTLTQLSIVGAVLQELVIGLSAGLILSILFGAAAKAGDQIATTAGLGFASQIDPASGSQSPVVAQLFSLMLLVIFLGEDGHLMALRIMLDSYTIVPIGAPIQYSAIIGAGLGAAGAMFLYALQLMLPVVTILLLLNIVIGVITRSAPTLNIFSFGFPLTLLVSIFVLYMTAPTLGSAMSRFLETNLRDLADVIKGLSNG